MDPATLAPPQNKKNMADADDAKDEITLFKDGVVVLKAQRGLSLGLLKLIYSSDESSCGVLLGVKPRLRDRVPCLLTFDSTALNCSQYDLIVQQEQSTGPSPRVHSTLHQLQSSLDNPAISNDARGVCEANTSFTSSMSVQASQESSLGGSGTSDHYEPQVVPLSEDNTPGAEYRPTSSPAHHLGDPLDSSLTGHDPPESGGYDTDSESLENTGTYCYPSSADARLSGEKLEECEENSGSELNVVEEDTRFNPEEFDFNINSITPLQTDKGPRWPCDRCNKDFCSLSHLKRHWILHTDFKPYKCSVCRKGFSFHWDLKKHMNKHTGNKPFKCPLCPKSFNSQKELRYHNWFHTGKKEFKCQICQHEFTSPGNLKVHTRKHTGEKPYKCDYCPKAFHMQGHRRYHVMRHTGERPYKCDVCGKGFSFSNNLTEHKNVHTGVRPHSCPHCSKKFTHRSTLKQHILVHEGSRPYKCHLCSKSFVQNSNYRIHLLTHKDKEARIQKCELCGKELLSQRGIQDHRLRCVKKTVEKVAAMKPTLTFKRGQYPCQRCPRVFTYHRRLLVHENMKHAAAHSEQVNDSRYRDEASEPVLDSRLEDGPDKPEGEQDEPVGDKQLDCPFCETTFVYNKKLEDHLQKAHADMSSQSVSISPSAGSRLTASPVVTSRLTVVCQQNVADVRVGTGMIGAQICVPSNFTVVHIPVDPEYFRVQHDDIRYDEDPISGPPVGPGSNDVASSNATERAPLAGPKLFGPLQQSLVCDKSSAKERFVTGSQALSALQRLSAQVGLAHEGVSHSEAPQNSGISQAEQALQNVKACGSVQSEHLSALAQLSQKVGNDMGFCAAGATLDPSTQIPLRYPCLQSVCRDVGNHGQYARNNHNEACRMNSLQILLPNQPETDGNAGLYCNACE